MSFNSHYFSKNFTGVATIQIVKNDGNFETLSYWSKVDIKVTLIQLLWNSKILNVF